jgi:hypothetical protein
VQGRYDIVCPPVTADALARAWPEAEYIVVPDAGHSVREPGITRELVEDAHLRERPRAVEQALVQHADAPRVEAVEAADSLDGGVVHLVDIINQMIDGVK